MTDDLLHQEIYDLEQRLGLVDEFELENANGPTPAQAAVISKAITDLEEEAGLLLDDDDFDRVGRLAFEELGGDIESAFGLVADEVVEDTDAWETEFQGQIEAKQAQLGRKLVPSEVDRIRDHHDDISDPDLEAAWTNIYGKRHTDEQVDAVEAKHQTAVEKLRTDGYSDEFVSEWDQQHRSKLEEKTAEMRRSGKGDFDLDSKEGRAAYMNARHNPPREIEEIAHDLRPVEEDEKPAAAIDRIVGARQEVDEILEKEGATDE